MQFLNDAGRIPLLTADEEIILGRTVQRMQALLEVKPDGPYDRQERAILHRGRKAKDRMITANMRLVAAVSKRFMRQCIHLEHEDLLQEGTLGLIRAVEKFDPERGYKFSTYAYWWIRQGMARALASYNRTIRLPSHANDSIVRLKVWMASKLSDGVTPSVAACAEFLGCDEDRARLYLANIQNVGSLDARLKGNDSEASALVEMIADDRAQPWELLENDPEEKRDLIRVRLMTMTESQRRVIELRMAGMETRQQIADALGVTRQRVGDIEASAIRILQTSLRNKA